MARFDEISKSIKKPRIKNFSQFVIDEHEVILKDGYWNSDSMTLRTDKNVSIAKLLGLFDGKTTWKNIISGLSRIESAEFKSLAEGLYENNMLEDAHSKKELKLSLLSVSGKILAKLVKSSLKESGEIKFSSLNDSDLVVICGDSVNVSKLDELNRKFVELNKPFVLILRDGRFGIIGPTVIPNKSACFRCFESRLQNNMSNYTSYTKIRNLEAASTIERYKLSFLASLGIREILKFKEKDSSTINKAIFVDFSNLDIELNPVYKLPRCHVCGNTVPQISPYINLAEIIRGGENGSNGKG